MSLAYHAAEYFIEAIGQSPSLSINYDFMTYISNCVEGEIFRYLSENSKGDIFFIFKKFPDVFRIKNGVICFTDAFLSLYALKRSTTPRGIKSSSSIKDYYENAAVSFFNAVISRYGPQHYLNLFHLLVKDSNQMISSYFCRYTPSNAYNFFLSHSDAFIMKNYFISLNIQSLIKAEQNTCDSPEAVKELTDSVYFLLTCFESLHFIELKQCISYVSNNAKNLLDQYSLIKQRRMFENLPKVKMDSFGFLSLTDFTVNISISDDKKILLLFVCILTFEREVHFQKMVSNIASGRSSVVNSICSLPLEEQLQYFRSKHNYFYTSDRGYISLLPSFICPICTFEGLTKNVQTNQSSVISEALCTTPEACDKSEKVSNHVDKQSETEDALCSKLSEIQQNATASVIKVWTEMLNLTDVSEKIKRQFIISILFLSKVIQQIDHKCVLKTLLYVFHDVKISFDSLSETDKHDFIRSCCKIFNSELLNKVELSPLFRKEIADEKVLIFITYLLTVTLPMHFEKIAAEIIKKNVASLSSSISKQYKFFRNFSELIIIRNDGYVILAKSFGPVNSCVESYSDLISQRRQKDIMIQNKSSKCILKGDAAAESNAITQPTSSTRNCISPSGNKTGNKASRRTRKRSRKLSKESKPKKDILQELNYSFFLIRKYFRNALDTHIIEAYLLAFSDAYKFFCTLSFEFQYNFIEECYQLIKSNNEKLSSDNCCDKISSQNDDLLCSYLIIREKSMHYQKIVTYFKNMSIDTILCEKTPSEQFKYFKCFGGYLEIDGDGFVTLHPSFNNISSIINSVFAFESRKSMKCKPVTELKQLSCSPPQNTLHKVDLSPRGVNMSIKNSSTNKNSPKKDDDENLKVSQVDATCIKDNGVCEKEVVKNSLNLPLQNEWDTKDVIIDLCVFILSTREKVSIEKLSCILNSCELRDVKNYFSLLTHAEKLEFFKKFSKYFTVSVDGFVSLKENVLNTYTSKTKISPSDVLCNSFSVLEKPTGCISQNKSDCILSADASLVSEEKNSSSCPEKPTSCKPSYIESSPNKFPHNFIEMGKSAKSLRNITSVIKPGEVKNATLAEHVKSEVIHVPHSKNETNGRYLNTSVLPKEASVINISSPKIVLGHNKSFEDTVSHEAFKACTLPKSHGFKSNICDTNSQERFKNKSELINIDNCKMATPGEPSISGTKKSKQVAVDNYTPEDEKCIDYVQIMASSFANLSLNDSEEYNTKSFEISEHNIFLDNDIPKVSTLFPSYSSTRSVSNEISSSIESKLSTKTMSNKSNNGATNKQDATNYLGFSNKFLSSDSLDGNTLSFAEGITPSLSTGNGNYNMSFSDKSHEDYITEIIDSYLGNSKKEPLTRKNSNFKNASISQDFQTIDTFQCSADGSKLHDNAKLFCSAHQAQDDQNLIEKSSVSSTSKCYSVPKNSVCSTSADVTNLSESRAVNFFCVILENYKNSKEGVSIDCLKEHLLLASSEVQSFMHNHFEDMLSFFRKHKSVFSVSPRSRIYLV